MNEEIRILLVEDEEVWRKSLTIKLNQLGYTVAGEADTFESAITLLNTAQYDLVLLDINLNKRDSGIELGHMINLIYKKPFIYISLTLDSMIGDKVAGTNPSAYLHKPANTISLRVAIQNALKRFSDPSPGPFQHTTTEQDFFFIKQGTNYKKLEWQDIVHLRSHKNYTLLYNASDKVEYSIRNTLTRTHQLILPEQQKGNFIQINRSEILQLSFISEIRGEEVRTKFGTYAVTDGYLDSLKSRMHILS